jgi:hypothetical protein
VRRLFIAVLTVFGVFAAMPQILRAWTLTTSSATVSVFGAGSFAYTQSTGVAVDASGNMYVTGDFSGTADFDPGAGTANLTSAGSVDAFVVKLDASGTYVWARQFGGSDYDGSSGVAVDGSGNTYVAGRFVGTADFDPSAGTANLTSAGMSNAFVVKLDALGKTVPATTIPATTIPATTLPTISSTSTTSSVSPQISKTIGKPRSPSVRWSAAKPLSAVVSWVEPSKKGASRLTYVVNAKENRTLQCRTAKMSCSFKLEHGKKYTFEIVATTGTTRSTAVFAKVIRVPMPAYSRTAEGKCLIARLPGMETLDLSCSEGMGSSLIASKETFRQHNAAIGSSPQERMVINRSLKQLSKTLGSDFKRTGSMRYTSADILDQFGDSCYGAMDFGGKKSELLEYMEATRDNEACDIYRFDPRDRIAKRSFDTYFQVMTGEKFPTGMYPHVSVRIYFLTVDSIDRYQSIRRLMLEVQTSWSFCEGEC